MATTYKPITSNDVATTKTLLHEAIPITGTIASGTYNSAGATELNIKDFSHGMFQSVYDYPFLSSSANHLFDLTVGYSNNSNVSASANSQNAKKINIYNQMAQVLMGYDATGSVLDFDRAMDVSDSGQKMKECIFINFSRLLVKDEIKKQSFTTTFFTGGLTTAVDPEHSVRTGTEYTIGDYNANTTFKTNSPAGEVGIMYSGSEALANTGVGLIFYQAGIAVVTGSIFNSNLPHELADARCWFGAPEAGHSTKNSGDPLPTGSFQEMLTGSNISSSCDGLRNRFKTLSFNNTTELNSTIYFCRANHNEFNYSANPTYLSASQLRVKIKKEDAPVSYITTIGLYSPDNVLIAVAKLSEPLKKDPSNEFTLRVRLDY